MNNKSIQIRILKHCLKITFVQNGHVVLLKITTSFEDIVFSTNVFTSAPGSPVGAMGFLEKSLKI